MRSSGNQRDQKKATPRVPAPPSATAATAPIMAGTDKTKNQVLGPAPIAVLVSPQLGENIGTAARAMANFGLHELRLVDPRDGWPNEKALTSSSGANWIIEKASVHESLEDCLRFKGFLDSLTPKDFFEKKVAMMWTTTGNLTNVRTNAKFDFGVAMLPAGKKRGSPTGGGNFYMFKDTTDEERAAALKLMQFMTSPEQAAAWSIGTGYMGVSPAAYETEALKAYVADFPPALVARNQLENAVAEFSTFETARVRDGLNNAIQSALTGSKTAAEALGEAQAAAERLLAAYQ